MATKKKETPVKEVKKEVHEDDLRPYELMVIVAPNIGEAGITKELDKIRKLIKSYSGKITNEDIWGHRELAYRIKKHDAGFYAVLNFVAPTELLPELHKILLIDVNIIRHMIIKPPKGYEIKTLKEFEAMDYTSDADKEKAAKKAEAEEKRLARQSAYKPRPATTAKPEAKKEEVKEEKVEAKKAPKKTANLDDKLKSIMDDTDLNL